MDENPKQSIISHNDIVCVFSADVSTRHLHWYKADKIKADFVNAINNENKMHPPLYLTPVQYEVCGKQVLYIRVPVSQDVCRCNGRICCRV